MAPFRSHMVTCWKPADNNSLTMEMAAAPAPEVTTFTSSRFLPTTFRALVSPARVMMAVPCWSSWKMGMSHFSFSFRSISKHRGAAMSSRLMPPKEPEML